jgi:hypothetical protein
MAWPCSRGRALSLIAGAAGVAASLIPAEFTVARLPGEHRRTLRDFDEIELGVSRGVVRAKRTAATSLLAAWKDAAS